MVKKRPHTITIKTSGSKIKDGELVNDVQLEITIKARFEPTFSLRKMKSGDEILISGLFYTNHEMINDARYVVFEDVEYKVVVWERFQSHGIIYVQN